MTSVRYHTSLTFPSRVGRDHRPPLVTFTAVERILHTYALLPCPIGVGRDHRRPITVQTQIPCLMNTHSSVHRSLRVFLTWVAIATEPKLIEHNKITQRARYRSKNKNSISLKGPLNAGNELYITVHLYRPVVTNILLTKSGPRLKALVVYRIMSRGLK